MPATNSPTCRNSTRGNRVDEGKNYADAQKEIKLPKYEALGGFGPFFPMTSSDITISIIAAFNCRAQCTPA